MKVAVFGAGGHLGREVVEALLARGIQVRAVGRSAAPLEARWDGRVDILAADVTTQDGAAAGSRGVDGIVYAIGLPYSGESFSRYPPMMRTALAAARAAGVKRFLHVAPVYPYGVPRTNPVSEEHPREPGTVKGRYRKAQEDLVLAADDPAGMRTLSLRLPDFFFGEDASFPGRILAAAREGKRADVIGPIDVPREFVHLPDAARVIAALFQSDDAWGQAYNLGGSGAITMRDLTERIYRAAGKKPSYRVAGKTMLRLLGLFDPLVRELVEMHYLATTPVILDDRKLAARIGPLRKTPYDEAIREALR